MTRLTAELREALAAEYVLGTQRPGVRRRIAELLKADADLQARIDWWQDSLEPLAGMLEPVSPPPWIWRRLETALQGEDDKPARHWWTSIATWRWGAGLAAALALVLLLRPTPLPVEIPVEVPVEVIVEVPVEVPVPAEGGIVLVLTDNQSQPTWLVSRSSADAPLKVESLELPRLTDQQVYELWLLPPEEAPISLGLLNRQGNTELQPGADLGQRVVPGSAMAVSLEPPGGSPTGAPTGPVVSSGTIRAL